MTRALLTIVAIACVPAAFAGQVAPAADTMTLIGCIAGGVTAEDPFTLTAISLGSLGSSTPGQVTTPAKAGTDTASGVAAPPATTTGYTLSGWDVAEFRGQHVQVVGTLVPIVPIAGAPVPAEPAPRELRVQSATPIAGVCP